MSDIVERLREWSVAVDNRELDGTEDGLLATDLMIAAAEIERLNKDYDTVVERMMEDDEEVERLKTELLDERKKHEWISVKDNGNEKTE